MPVPHFPSSNNTLIKWLTNTCSIGGEEHDFDILKGAFLLRFTDFQPRFVYRKAINQENTPLITNFSPEPI